MLIHVQPYRDGKRVLECLQRALRVADACMDTAVSVELFVEILNRYVYYFDQENEAVSPNLCHLNHPLKQNRSPQNISTASSNSYILTLTQTKTKPPSRIRGGTLSGRWNTSPHESTKGLRRNPSEYDSLILDHLWLVFDRSGHITSTSNTPCTSSVSSLRFQLCASKTQFERLLDSLMSKTVFTALT